MFTCTVPSAGELLISVADALDRHTSDRDRDVVVRCYTEAIGLGSRSMSPQLPSNRDFERLSDETGAQALEIGADRAGSGRAQCRNCRSPVNSMVIPRSSAAAIVSGSLTDPPGWITTVTPASAAASMPSRKG